MRNLFLIFATALTLLLFASSTSAKNSPIDSKVLGSEQNWGFVLVEPKNLINGKNYVGYGGFRDEASCTAEAKKHLKSLPNSSKLEVRCFSPFQKTLTPYKVAQQPVG